MFGWLFGHWSVFKIIVVLVVVGFIVAVLYYRHERQQAQLREEVRNMLFDYMPLQDIELEEPTGYTHFNQNSPIARSYNNL